MTSNLTIDEFRVRLKTLVRIGEPSLTGLSVYNSSSQPFFGKFDDSEFIITKNTWIFITPYFIKGRYFNSGASGTKVDFKIVSVWWYRLIVPFPILFLIITNISIFTNSELNLEFILLPNFMVALSFLPIIAMRSKKRKLEKNFVEKFEIADY